MDSPQKWTIPEIKNAVWSLRRLIGREENVGVKERGKRRRVWRVKLVAARSGCEGRGGCSGTR
jgi:hypothetical protein